MKIDIEPLIEALRQLQIQLRDVDEEKETPKLDPHTLKNGVYRIYWADGGYSVASVGRDKAGKVWSAPANWVSCGRHYNWNDVDHVELIEESPH